MDFRMVAYEGILARDLLVLIDSDPFVEAYQEEPPSFAWTDGVDWRSYTPDFAVSLIDGRSICVEVKPIRNAGRLTEAFISGVRDAALGAGYSAFEVWTERQMSGLAIANASLLASERSFVVDEAELHTVRRAIDSFQGLITIRELRRLSGLGRRAYRAIIGLIARRELLPINSDVPLDDHALLRRV